MTHYVQVLQANGKVINKAYTKTSESDIAFHIEDYAKYGSTYGVKVLSVTHTDGSKCEQFVGA